MKEWMNEWKNECKKECIDKKDGFVWIVDLKLRRKLKGKQEKNNGGCQVVDLHKSRKKKMGVGQSCVFE